MMGGVVSYPMVFRMESFSSNPQALWSCNRSSSGLIIPPMTFANSIFTKLVIIVIRYWNVGAARSLCIRTGTAHSHTAPALAAAVSLFIILACPVLGSEAKPEGNVWTQPRADFWEGQQTVSLPCRVQGEPLVVSWLKDGSVIDQITWTNRGRSGRSYRDGSLNITDDYSLVFKQPVKLRDTGKYTCRVYFKSETQAIHNHTTVTVAAFQIQATPKLTVWKGETASLPCGLPYTPFRVHWLNASSGEVVASYTDGTFSTPDDGNGRFSMEKDFSLTIREVSVLDEATLMCKVFAIDSRSWNKSTELTVNAYADGPSIDGCHGSEYCNRKVNSREFQLSCSVCGAKPDVNMSFTPTGNSKITLLQTSFESRQDGTCDQTINASFKLGPESRNETITCTASGVAISGTRSATITVFMKSGIWLTGPFMAAMTAIPLIIIICVICIYRNRFRVQHARRRATYMLSLLSQRFLDNGGSLNLEQQETYVEGRVKKLVSLIQLYKPGGATGRKLNIDKVNLHVLGGMAAGKSAFIKSVIFALKVDQSDAMEGLSMARVKFKQGDETGGEVTIDKKNLGLRRLLQSRKSEYADGTNASGVTDDNHTCLDDVNDTLDLMGSIDRTPHHITNHITLFEHKGLECYPADPSASIAELVKILEVLVQGKKELQCAIFVGDISNEKEIANIRQIVRGFFLQKDHLRGVPLKYVFTYNADTETSGFDLHALFPEIPKEDMIGLKAYAGRNLPDGIERRIELLKFIWHCIKTSERVNNWT